MTRKLIRTLILLVFSLSACQTAPPSPAAPVQTQPPASGASAANPGTRPPTRAAIPVTEAAAPTLSPTLEITATQSITPTHTTAANTWDGPLPILLIDNQGLTYGPGQIISVYAQGFQPGEDIAVAVVHASQGVVFNKTAKADALGHVQTARRLTKSAQDKDALPAGSYTYQLTGAAQVQKFTFQVDYTYQPPSGRRSGCGFHPYEAVFEGHLAFFCQGLLPNTSYTLTARQGEKYDAIITTSDPFGQIVFPLRLTSKTLSPGTWRFSLGKTTAQSGAPIDLGFPIIAIPVLSQQEVHP